MVKQVALVTGTSSGIGLSAAILFAKSGFTTIATVRSEASSAKLRERADVEGVEVHVRLMDVSSDKSVSDALTAIFAEFGQVDILVNNAGVGYLGALENTPISDAHHVMEANFFGVWRVTQGVLSQMRERRSGRIISVSSFGGIVGQPFNDVYCASKFAVEGLMESLAPVMKRLGVHVSCVEPGAVSSEFVHNVSRPDGLPEEYGKYFENYTGATKAVFAHAQSPDDCAKVILKAATDAQPHFRYQSTEMVTMGVSRKLVDPTGDSVVELSGSRLGPA